MLKGVTSEPEDSFGQVYGALPSSKKPRFIASATATVFAATRLPQNVFDPIRSLFSDQSMGESSVLTRRVIFFAAVTLLVAAVTVFAI
ncbi:hypothetical protein [Paraburkholderia strydomiana]|uniref:hypothetical protein n=1 Tax=Paraburkholderia strydomiana TaxID=1245417 RepID=UPI002859E170|nr:hypothetical protein [Paraburkholderia strydomiana]MDR7009599.1 hypothetical protein [Paraburkholderia strydomiana]